MPSRTPQYLWTKEAAELSNHNLLQLQNTLSRCNCHYHQFASWVYCQNSVPLLGTDTARKREKNNVLHRKPFTMLHSLGLMSCHTFPSYKETGMI